MISTNEYKLELTSSLNEMLHKTLKADCQNCFGFCCVALYFSKSEGFPQDKSSGTPCVNLQEDFNCRVHCKLKALSLKGCISYDCLGAGQRVAQVTYNGCDWRKTPKAAEQMYEVFLIMVQLHEMLMYLSEAILLEATSTIKDELGFLLNETESFTLLSADSISSLDISAHRAKVNQLLVQTSEFVRTKARSGMNIPSKFQRNTGRNLDLMGADLRRRDLVGANLRGACLIASNLRNVDLTGADFIGADLRDADLSGATLVNSIFLTQAQINTTKGDSQTRLPTWLSRPVRW